MSTTTIEAGRMPRRSGTVDDDPRFRVWDHGVFIVLTVAHVAVITVVLERWLTTVDWGPTRFAVPALIATVFAEILLWEWRWMTLPLMRVPRPRPAAQEWRVGMAVTFVPSAEPIAMLEETVRALAAIRYPHDTWVLDEGDDPEVRDLCARHGVHHFSRAGIDRFQQPAGPFRARTKYGNYNAWLETHGYESYDLIVAVDSDHILRTDYLDRIIGYFDDPDVAFVQPAQVYYNQDASLVARGAAEETYAYYSSLLMAAQGVGYPLVVGCHNTHRVSALREIGGFAPHEADDMVMTLLYRARGWRGIYVPEILAKGIVPADWCGYLRQQRRWARSVLDYKFRIFPRYGSKLPWIERVLNYVHGLFYLRGIVTALQIALLIIVLATGFLPPGRGTWLLRDVLLVGATLFLCEMYRQRFFLDRSEWGIHWRSKLLDMVKWPWFVLATLDAIRGRYGEYVITAKHRVARAPGLFVAVHIAVIGATALAWLIGMVRGPIEFVALHVGAAIVAAISIAAVLLVRVRPVPAWSARLRQQWREHGSADRDLI